MKSYKMNNDLINMAVLCTLKTYILFNNLSFCNIIFIIQ